MLKVSRMRASIFTIGLVLLIVASARCPTAKAGLVIDGTFGTSITSLSDASTVEAGIDSAISRLEAAIATPITVNIDFEDDTSVGLGESDTNFGIIPYSQYLSDLKHNQTLSALDNEAIASLPVQTKNPVNGNDNVELTLPLLRAIGESAAGDNGGGLDSTISLNLPIMNVSRTGTQNPDDYDLQAVVGHEMDEVLGIGGAGSELTSSGTTGPVGPMDLFRYSAPGVRSYSLSTNVAPYFSLNSGTTDLVHFNQFGNNSDYGDWGNGVTPAQQDGNTPPQIQDAFGDPGVDINLGTNELIAFDVVGYNLTSPVPEPGNVCLLAGGLITVAFYSRRLHQRRPRPQ
jgi:hypothetical protein